MAPRSMIGCVGEPGASVRVSRSPTREQTRGCLFKDGLRNGRGEIQTAAEKRGSWLYLVDRRRVRRGSGGGARRPTRRRRGRRRSRTAASSSRSRQPPPPRSAPAPPPSSATAPSATSAFLLCPARPPLTSAPGNRAPSLPHDEEGLGNPADPE